MEDERIYEGTTFFTSFFVFPGVRSVPKRSSFRGDCARVPGALSTRLPRRKRAPLFWAGLMLRSRPERGSGPSVPSRENPGNQQKERPNRRVPALITKTGRAQ